MGVLKYTMNEQDTPIKVGDTVTFYESARGLSYYDGVTFKATGVVDYIYEDGDLMVIADDGLHYEVAPKRILSFSRITRK